MKAKQSEFVTWFEAQHGQRYSGLDMNRLQTNFLIAQDNMIHSRKILEKCQEYDARFESALRAVNAFGIFKDEKVK